MSRRKGELAKLAAALKPFKKKKKHGGNPNPVRSVPPPEQYRFKPGQSGNPSGRPREYVLELTGRLMRSSPPPQLCMELGIDPGVSWGEAILISLSRAAVAGDVSAAREVLSTLGFTGTASRNVLAVNVENNPAERGLAFEFLRHAHGIGAEDMPKVWAYMDSLPREKPVVDASYFPDASYQEQEQEREQETKQLPEGQAD